MDVRRPSGRLRGVSDGPTPGQPYPRPTPGLTLPSALATGLHAQLPHPLNEAGFRPQMATALAVGDLFLRPDPQDVLAALPSNCLGLEGEEGRLLGDQVQLCAVGP
eukprot:11219637-Lingulodinium_polyedra.AAC.1